MSEIEKAIATLEIMAKNLIGDVQNGNELGTMNYKAIDKAIQALQEKAEREKGCEYCKGDVDERPSLINDDNGYIYIDGNGKLDLNDMHEVQLYCCPMCGRKLAEG